MRVLSVSPLFSYFLIIYVINIYTSPITLGGRHKNNSYLYLKKHIFLAAFY